MPTPAPVTLGRVERLYRALALLREMARAEASERKAPATEPPAGPASLADLVPDTDTPAELPLEVTDTLTAQAMEAGIAHEMALAVFVVTPEEAEHVTVQEVADALPGFMAASSGLIRTALALGAY